jgi:L-type amino acid transporter 6
MVSSETQPLLSEPQSHGFRVRTAPNTFPRPSEAELSCPDESQPLDTPDPPRSLTFMNGLALVIGIQIGSGIFSTPSAIFDDVGSPEVAMLVWLLAGFLAWTGAASFIELGSIVPHNGGAQEYLRHCYNDICGFLAALTWVLVVKPISVAMVSLVFSEYLYRAFTLQETPSIWILKGVALSVVILITYMNCIGTKVGAGTANVFLILKLFGLGSIIVTGLALGVMSFQSTNKVPLIPGDRTEDDLNLWGNFGAYTDATLAALWTYSGWESVSIFLAALWLS